MPITTEVELIIDETGKNVILNDIPFDINEWDEYALEEAVRLKERLEGNVIVINVSSHDNENVILKCLAKGADKAIKIVDKSIPEYDAYTVAKILYEVIKNMKYDLILCGAQAGDDGYALVGVILASLLRIPYATMVKNIELLNNRIRVIRELEEGYEEIIEMDLPALLTIQTGINEPRYASIMSIRRAKQKPIVSLNIDSINITTSTLESWIEIQEFFIPKKRKECKKLSGHIDEIVTKILEVLKQRGLK